MEECEKLIISSDVYFFQLIVDLHIDGHQILQ